MHSYLSKTEYGRAASAITVWVWCSLREARMLKALKSWSPDGKSNPWEVIASLGSDLIGQLIHWGVCTKCAFRRWGLVRGSRFPVVILCRVCLDLGPFLSYSLPCLPHGETAFLFPILFCMNGPRINAAKWPGTETLMPATKKSPSSESVYFRYVAQYWKG